MNKAILRLSAGLGMALALSACASIKDHKGYITDEVLLSAVQPGVDNRESVKGTLGQPTLTSQFGDPVWYYISSRTEQSPFGRPQIKEHHILAVHFDDAGNVTAAERSGMEAVARVSIDGDETPTLGRERGFLEDLFGNIGQVGTLGAGGAGPAGP